MDNLDIRWSQALVKVISFECDFGHKGRKGILVSIPGRGEILRDPSHRIRFF